MLIHSVYFWLNADVDGRAREAFREGLESLRGIHGVKELHVGIPAATPPRPVLISDYDFGLVVFLENVSFHDVYQNHPLHQDFLKKFSSCWNKVQIFDIV